MRFQVPQFVDIEDKIIGPLTLKQFLMYVVAVMVLTPVYMLADLGLLITIAIPVLGVAALFAHAKFYGQSFAAILMGGLSYIMGEKLFLWRRVSSAKFMRIGGGEYDLDTASVAQELPESSLKNIERMLNTQGNIIGEDASDPLTDEEEIFEAGKMQNQESRIKNQEKSDKPKGGNSQSDNMD